MRRTIASAVVLLWCGIAVAQRAPVPGPAADNDARHAGVDLAFAAGDAATLPQAAMVTALVSQPAGAVAWQSAVLRLEDGLVLRVVGIAVSHPVGARVAAGAELGTLQNARDIWPRVVPHLHVEVYRDAVRIDAEPVAAALFPGHAPINPGNAYFRVADSAQQMAAEAAWDAFDAQRFNAAIPLFERARVLLPWEGTNHRMLAALAFANAQTGDYAKAAALQEQYLAQLDMLLDYAAGKLPAAELGAVAAVASVESLTALRSRGRANLAAYRSGQPALTP